jgi:hypothetical protein
MNRIYRLFRFLPSFAILWIWMAAQPLVYGQTPATLHLSGEEMRGLYVPQLHRDTYFVWSDRKLFQRREIEISDGTLIWNAPTGREIVHAEGKAGNDNIVIVLLDDGSVYLIDFSDLYPARKIGTVNFSGTFGQLDFDKVAGDALYAHSLTGLVVVSRDTAKTWSLDSSGLGNNASVQDIALDSSQYVYAGMYNNGLYKQHPDSSVWHRVDSLYWTDFYHRKFYATVDRVFIDRFDRIWVDMYGSSSGAYMSTDHGSTWSHDTTGIGSTYVVSFGDDKFGNIYVITKDYNGTRMYRSKNAGQSWTRIDQPLTAMNVNSSLSSAPFSYVGGDSLIFVTTSFGVFQSSDQGTTWADANQGITTDNIYSMLKLSSGDVLASTDLGIFRRNANDTIWTKTYPLNSYFGGRPLYRDGLGNVYTLGNFILPAYQYFVYKSTDEGATWNPDSAGVMHTPSDGAFYVDETGAQHAVTASGSPSVANIYSKPLNGSWQPDTNGFSAFSSGQQHGSTFGSDGAGFLYLAGTFNRGNLWRRPVGGGSWNLDTAGLNTMKVSSFTTGRNGDILAIASSGFNSGVILRRSAGVWSQIGAPFASALPSIISVDSTNAILAAFFQASGFTAISKGVYFTTDGGSSWTYAGLNNMTINTLVSYGDTTYALTQGNGAYLLRHQLGTSVALDKSVPALYSLSQNYPNPFNPSTTIRFTTPARGRVTLRIFDILGREVATILNGDLDAGSHQATFNASRLSSGIYFYRMHAGAFSQTRKLVLMK